MAGKDEKKVTKAYRVVSNLRHGGKHYNPGTKVELTQEEATFLLDRGVIAEIPAK